MPLITHRRQRQLPRRQGHRLYRYSLKRIEDGARKVFLAYHKGNFGTAKDDPFGSA
jgi:hypothetical protein